MKGLPSKTGVVNASSGSMEETVITVELLLEEVGYEEDSVGEVWWTKWTACENQDCWKHEGAAAKSWEMSRQTEGGSNNAECSFRDRTMHEET